ncbi:MAG: T9SS type A sorting domain-containing protein, partial [Saprospiraceae bacterium]|nr:T9SS type A sorting domain-containing protein [Saprospiraceae bacterium]
DQTDTQTDTETVPVPNPSLSIEKEAIEVDEAGNGIIDEEGDIIKYSITLTNNGSANLTNVLVNDDLTGTVNEVCGSGNLAPGESCTVMVMYTVTQDDLDNNGVNPIDNGFIDNTATGDSDQTDPVTDSEEVPVVQDPSIQIIKTGVWNDDGDGVDPTTIGDGYGQPGETITYTFLVKNTGNVTLHDVSLDDPMTGLSLIDCAPENNPIDFLAPGEEVTCTAFYILTQENIDAGTVENIATAVGMDPNDDPVDDPDDEIVPIPQDPSITLVKEGMWNDDGPDGIAGTGDLGEGDGFAQEGETISYTFLITNDGNVTLDNVILTDPMITVDCGTFDGILEPGESVTCTGTYEITEMDLDLGVKVNEATVTGEGPQDQPVEDMDDHTEPLIPLPEEICTFTKGFWGNPNGKHDGSTTEEILETIVSLENPVIIGDLSGSYLSIGSVECILELLPGGGNSKALKPNTQVVLTGGDCSDAGDIVALHNNGEIKNGVVTQLIAFELNTRFDPILNILKLSLLDAYIGDCIEIPQSIIDAIGYTGTLEDLKAYANQALGGTINVSQRDLNDLNDFLTALNEFFDECGKLECKNASIGNYVWNDLDKNGLQDDFETGINGVIITLYTEDDTFVASTVSGSDPSKPDGYYIFDNLGSGNYYLTFEYPPIYNITPQDMGDDELDSDIFEAQPFMGMTSIITLSAGEENMTIDAGLNPQTILPVELGSFTATAVERVVKLNWTTLTEVNSLGFYVERRTDKFKEFEEIGFVEAAGNSNAELNYEFLDRSSKSANRYYYRLRMVDNDGQEEYSDIRSVVLDQSDEFKFYPNPTNGSLFIDIPENYDKATIHIFDQLGTSIKRIELQNERKGLMIDLSEYKPGIYTFKLTGEFITQTRRIIVVTR